MDKNLYPFKIMYWNKVGLNIWSYCNWHETQTMRKAFGEINSKSERLYCLTKLQNLTSLNNFKHFVVALFRYLINTNNQQQHELMWQKDG